MPFVVVYDADVLYPSVLRDLLIRIAQAGLVQAKWTQQILDETFGSLKRNRPDLDPRRLDRTRELVCESVRDCLVTGYEPLIEMLELPDRDDRHVLAAAIKARAQVIVTSNLHDFPDDQLSQWDVEAKDPDEFVCDQTDLDKSAVHRAVHAIRPCRPWSPIGTRCSCPVAVGSTGGSESSRGNCTHGLGQPEGRGRDDKIVTGSWIYAQMLIAWLR